MSRKRDVGVRILTPTQAKGKSSLPKLISMLKGFFFCLTSVKVATIVRDWPGGSGMSSSVWELDSRNNDNNRSRWGFKNLEQL